MVGAAVVAGVGIASIGASGCVYYLNPQCNDQIHNGDETDIDCGGACGACATGAICARAADCQSLSCAGSGTCAAPSCSNGVQDGFETDLDCGGECGGCTLGGVCWSSGDCASGQCGEPCTGALCGMYSTDKCR